MRTLLAVAAGLLSACAGTASTPLGDLSYDEYLTAVATARREIAEDHATATGATARVHRGAVPLEESNTGHACESGRLLEITIAGTFPDLVTTGFPGARPEDLRITAVVLTADADTGEVCRQGVHAGELEPDHRAVVLDLDDRLLGDPTVVSRGRT